MLKIRENVPLAGFTTLGVGGSARFFVEATSEESVLRAIEFASTEDIPLAIIGGGSNLVVSDDGFEGLVLRVAISGLTFADEGEFVRLVAGAGVEWDRLVAECVERNLAGLECLSGIPGWVGGTPIQNVGAYGQDVSAVIAEVRAFDRQRARIRTFDNRACGFEYRKSIFNTTSRGRYVILNVVYCLGRGTKPSVSYPDLVEFFEGQPAPSLRRVREAVLRIRREKAMVLDPDDPDSRSVGSFFKNPLLTANEFERLLEIAPQPPPHFSAGEGHVKIPAAWLIERSGFEKGTRRERVGLSTRHSLALVNLGAASASDVVRFAGEIQERVGETFGVRLVPEPVLLGFPPEVIRSLGAVSVVEL